MITLVQPYYNHKNTFRAQLEAWSQWSEEAKSKFEIIITDDCSKEFPLEVPPDTHGLDLKLLRVEDDILWNDTGADNLGFQEAKYDWVLHCDLDLCVTPECADALLEVDLSAPYTAYWPKRNDTRYPKSHHRYPRHNRPARNAFLMNVGTFWEAGGYDEDFCGFYGYSDTYFHEVCCTKLGLTKVILEDIELETLHADDSTVQGLSHIKKESRNRQLISDKTTGKLEQATDHIRFKWRQL